MRKSSLAILASMLCLGALPAAAAVHQMGAVNISADRYTHATWTDFNGPVARLSFVPANDAIDCDHITVNYRDGTSHDVFSGTLLADQKETITFPDRDSRLASVNFACKAQSRDGARIDLSAVSDGDGLAYNGEIDRPANVTTYQGGDVDVYVR
jgi:hypothetical protein